MPIRYEVEDETGIVVVTHTGLISFDEWRAHLDRMLSDPALKRPLRVLADQRMREGVPSAGDVRQTISGSAKLMGSRDRVAFVVSRQVLFGMGRVAGAYYEIAGVTGTRVFYDIEEAREWLLGEGEL